MHICRIWRHHIEACPTVYNISPNGLPAQINTFILEAPYVSLDL